MTIKITNRVLTESVGALSQVGALLLPMASIKPIAKVMRVLQTELNDVTVAQTAAQKEAEALPREEMETDEQYAARKSKYADQKIQEFYDIEIEIPVDKFSADLLGDQKMGASVLMILDWLIDF